MMTGESRYYLNLSDASSIEHMQQAIQKHRQLHSDLPWLIGVNWDQTRLGRYPNREDIDAVCSDLPVFLWRACWHIAVVNTRAMEVSGIDIKRYEDGSNESQGGVIDLDSETKLPTGILRENAVAAVIAAQGRKDDNDKKRYIYAYIRTNAWQHTFKHAFIYA